MAGERVDVGHELRGARLRGGPAHAAAQRDRLARDLALEGAEEELARVRRVEEVEAGPVYGARGRREGVVGVPEEGGGVGEVAGVC
jgi:hypothetical protein